MESAAWVQVLDEVVCIPFRANAMIHLFSSTCEETIELTGFFCLSQAPV